jgi:uncharacterized protein
MKWQGRRQSSNVQDRRGQRVSRGGGGRRSQVMPIRIRSGKGILVVVVLALVAWAFGGNPMSVLQLITGGMPTQQQATTQPYTPTAAEQELAEMVKVVLADTEAVWTELMPQFGQVYREPTLILFSGGVQSACGFADSAVGPFYCGADNQIYIDLSFYEMLRRQFGAPGDFAQAYVIAHEVGHHIQNLLGISGRVQQQRASVSDTEYNRLSVRLELQADFLAGVWAHHAQKMFDIVEEGDIDEALRAASAIGDDAIQRKMQGRVVPDSFTHGTSDQRVRWFRLGYETGDLSMYNTFEVPWGEL